MVESKWLIRVLQHYQFHINNTFEPIVNWRGDHSSTWVSIGLCRMDYTQLECSLWNLFSSLTMVCKPSYPVHRNRETTFLPAKVHSESEEKYKEDWKSFPVDSSKLISIIDDSFSFSPWFIESASVHSCCTVVVNLLLVILNNWKKYLLSQWSFHQVRVASSRVSSRFLFLLWLRIFQYRDSPIFHALHRILATWTWSQF